MEILSLWKRMYYKYIIHTKFISNFDLPDLSTQDTYKFCRLSLYMILTEKHWLLRMQHIGK